MTGLITFLAGTHLLAAANAALASGSPSPPPHPVLELRQYKIVDGKRDTLIRLFEQNFVESQEADGMHLVGQFRDLRDPDRFTWMRSFPSMAVRAKALGAFYFGPVWQAHRDEANPLLDDNDNVFLLRPAWEGANFPASPQRPGPGATVRGNNVIVATIVYLWKEPSQGFAARFRENIAPLYTRAGLPVIACFIPEKEPNNFPRLHVREGERVLIWFTRVSRAEDFQKAMRRLKQDPVWRSSAEPLLKDAEERPPQHLFLQPTPRSELR